MSEHTKAAERKWGRKSAPIEGDGPYALLAWCKTLTVRLHPSMQEAEKSKANIDQIGCGGTCSRRHEIVDVRQKRISYKYSPK